MCLKNLKNFATTLDRQQQKVVFKRFVHQVSIPICNVMLQSVAQAVHQPTKNVLNKFLTCFQILAFGC